MPSSTSSSSGLASRGPEAPGSLAAPRTEASEGSGAVEAPEAVARLGAYEIPYIAPPDRPVPAMNVGTAAVTAIVVFVVALGAWEMHWRQFGSTPSYRNSEGLWAMQRQRIDRGEGHRTVLIGSSRTLSNINLDVWERLAGERPIQLALEGTSPLRPLEQLAEDEDFTGRLIVGVAPGLFFTGFEYRGAVFDYYEDETLAQRAGQRLSMWLVEPYFGFYDPDFALFTVLKRQPWPQREGAPASMDVRKLFVSDADRNMRMWRKVETDVGYQDLAKRIWAQEFHPPDEAQKQAGAKALDEQLRRAAVAVEKLKKRGVEVTFVLHPVDGEFAKFELGMLPRASTWDPLLERTRALGVHFQDYPELQGLTLPEWSHLSAADAEIYTERLYRILERKRTGASSQAGR